MRPEERTSPSPHLCCVLCNSGDETPITGPLSRKENIAAHQNCLLFASGIYCKSSPTFDDLFGFDVEDVKNECRRGRKLKCSYCKKNGATAGCEIRSCKRSYHYPCIHKANAIPEENSKEGIYTLYCEKHNRGTNNGEKGDPKVHPSTSPDTSEQENSRGGSEPSCTSPTLPVEPSCSMGSSSTKLQNPLDLLFPLGDCETPKRRSQNRKRKYLRYSSDSDETQDLMAPVESDLEDNTTQMQNKEPTLDSENRRRDSKAPRQEVAHAPNSDDAEDSDLDSPSLLQTEFGHDNIQFTVIADSGPSIESVAENSPDPCSPDAPREVETPVSKLDQSVCGKAIVKITQLPNLPGSDSPPPFNTGESSIVIKKELFDSDEKRCASRNIPPLQMPDKLPGSHDHPLDLTAPAGCSMARVQDGQPVGRVDVTEMSASLFWRRCNEMGCTESIFTELTRQLTSLAERVQNQHATQQDYAVSLRILHASGKLPAIYKQLEQDLKDQERQLQKKMEALRHAKAMLEENNLI